MDDTGDDEVAHDQQKIHVNGYEYDPDDPEDDVYTDDAFFWQARQIQLDQGSSQQRWQPIEYIYRKDSTGRVMGVEACLKVPRTEQMDRKDQKDHNDLKEDKHDRKEQKEHSNKRGEGSDARKTV
jgi:hypothetical protein